MGRWWCGQFCFTGREQAVGRFYDRHICIRYGEAHHRSAHNEAVVFLALVTGFFYQILHRGADQYLKILRFMYAFSGDSGNSGNKRLPVYNSVENSHSAADVLADNANLRGQTAAGHLFSCEDLNELLFAAGGILGGERDDLDICTLSCRTQSGNAFWFIVLDTDQSFFRSDDLPQNFCALNDLVSLFAHQDIVSSDVRLTLCAVDDQCFNLGVRLDRQFDRARKTGAAHACNSGIANYTNQVSCLQFLIVRDAAVFCPLILAV